jgi:hypothetical protein
VAYRGITLSITFDEVYTYLLGSGSVKEIMFDVKNFNTANNHVLNSLLIKPCLYLFGHQVWVLRLPSMLSYILFYSACVFLVKRMTPNILLRILGLVMICMNMYLFDFFSLSRGYALANAFEACSVLALFIYVENNQRLYCLLGFICAGFAVLANFTWLNFYLPLWLSLNAYFYFFQEKKSIWQWVKLNLIPVLITILMAIVIYLPMSFLRKNNEFKWGANAWFDSFHTFTKKYLLLSSFYTTVTLQVAILAVFVWAVMIVIKKYRNKMHDFSALSFLTILILSIVLATIAQRFLLGVMYMDGRKSTMYFILFGLLFIAVLNYAGSKFKIGLSLASAALILLWLINIAFNFNMHLVSEWSYDAYTKEALVFFKPKEHATQTAVCSSWEFGSGLNYYNQYVLHNKLMLYSMNDHPSPSSIDYYYVKLEEMNLLPPNVELVTTLPNSHLIYKRKD